MSDPQITRPDHPGADGWPFAQAPGPRPVGAVRRVLQAFGAVLGVQFLAGCIALLVLTSYRRAAAEWLLPLIAIADLLVTLQIGWLAVRDIRLSGGRPAVARFVLTFLIAALLAGAGAGAYAVDRHAGRPVAAAFGAPATDGDFRFTAAPPECGHKVERIVVRGVMCRVRLVVANTGSVEVRFGASAQRLDGEDAELPGLLVARGRGTHPAWTLPPGGSVRGYLVFDAPRGFVPRTLVLHGSEDGRGVRYRVG
ncbi:DUF4352 domain-containing protein [Actinomadura sp. WMMB 499]|uniref:DUF4352 domain-containing protein n=1 Tax=Actinomadura sp. WMMB 499 TaxID=1219491 RepID=UPI0012450B69|nr:DUF4352 domain-containing protein [Actinomadura sp. WMMB 499]QFG21830.1 DUF4352 domain-containing protein [Actinomadura sp. WMMB 499]